MESSRRGTVDSFIVMDVMEAARKAEVAGRSIVHMEVGQPGTPAPLAARRSLARQLEKDNPMGYTVALGLPALRQRIAELYKTWYSFDLSPERVVITPGSSGGFVLAFLSLFDTGARVGIGAPGYPSYRQILKSLDLVPVDLPTSEAARLQPTADSIKALDLQGLLVASPANPSGTMLDRAALSVLIDAAHTKGAAFISDEIYHGIEYEKKAVSALEVSDNCYVINSFSKYFSMTGWRVGWMVVPEDHVRRIERLAQNLFLCSPHASQLMALAAIDCDTELQANLAVYAENRRLMLAHLPQAGFDRIAPPDGAFYIYADVSALTNNSLDLAREILNEVGVAVTPGLDFDPVRGHQTLRFSYARSTEDILTGLGRLKDFMASRKSF